MPRRSSEATLALSVGAGLLVLLAISQMRTRETPAAAPGPNSLAEAVPIAEAHGLYARSDRTDGKLTERLVVSERPLSAYRANSLYAGNLDHPCWAGTVAVSLMSTGFERCCDSGHYARWGRLIVFGDPVLVRRLTGTDPAPGGAVAAR